VKNLVSSLRPFLLAAAIAAAATIVAYVGLLHGPLGERSKLQAQLAELREPPKQQRVVPDEETLRAADTALPRRVSERQLREALNSAAARAGVSVKLSDVRTDRNGVSATVKVTGGARKVAEMLADLHSRVVLTEDGQIRASDALVLLGSASVQPNGNAATAQAAVKMMNRSTLAGIERARRLESP
jgi:type II secretory pathway component PulM